MLRKLCEVPEAFLSTAHAVPWKACRVWQEARLELNSHPACSVTWPSRYLTQECVMTLLIGQEAVVHGTDQQGLREGGWLHTHQHKPGGDVQWVSWQRRQTQVPSLLTEACEVRRSTFIVSVYTWGKNTTWTSVRWKLYSDVTGTLTNQRHLTTHKTRPPANTAWV